MTFPCCRPVCPSSSGACGAQSQKRRARRRQCRRSQHRRLSVSFRRFPSPAWGPWRSLGAPTSSRRLCSFPWSCPRGTCSEDGNSPAALWRTSGCCPSWRPWLAATGLMSQTASILFGWKYREELIQLGVIRWSQKINKKTQVTNKLIIKGYMMLYNVIWWTRLYQISWDKNVKI